jgi:hypothetical protein
MREQLFTAKGEETGNGKDRREQLFTAKDQEGGRKEAAGGKVRRWLLPLSSHL